MTKANRKPTTSADEAASPALVSWAAEAARAGTQDGGDRHALLDIEENLRQLAAAEKLLGHIAVTELEIEGDEIAAVQGMIGDAHTAIEQRWRLAHKQRQAELEARAAELVAHAAELAAAKAERGAPGSTDDIKKAEAYWWLLRGAAKTALDACDKAEEDDIKKAEAYWWLLRGAAKTALDACDKAEEGAAETTNGGE